MIAFDYFPRTRIVFGPGSIAQLGERARGIGGRRVFVVSDPGIVAAGHAQRGLDSLASVGIATQLFQGVHENPTTADVDRGVDRAVDFQPDLIVGLGGGSSMDCAKGINFILTNGGQMKDYWGVGKATKPLLPMMAVPTTSGTGSETQSFALIADAETHVKMACGDEKAAFRVAILDPDLTLTQPPRVTALTGVDAISHAVESYVTNRSNPVSLLFSREAWRLLGANFSRVLSEPQNIEARGAMQLGACYAGLAIENSMLGIAHSLANPLTSEYGIVHGQAIATMLPHVIRFNAEQCGSSYAELAHQLSLTPSQRESSAASVEALIEFINRIVRQADLPQTLREQDVRRETLSELSQQAARQWTAQFNPRPVNAANLLGLYEDAFE